MASQSEFSQTRRTAEETEALLDELEKLIERTKVMYEQYFMGIQKMPPSHLHNDLERRIREITQETIRNTGLRFRFTTLKQKYGSYNTYWRRVMRQIEQGRYVRDLQRVGRRALQAGEEMPEELLAKLPKRMQDKIRRDRAAIADRAVREGRAGDGAPPPAAARKPASPPPGKDGRGAFMLDDADFGDGGLFDGMFDALTTPAPEEGDAATAAGRVARAARSPNAPPPSSSAAKPSPPPAVAGRPVPPIKPPVAAGARPPAVPPAGAVKVPAPGEVAPAAARSPSPPPRPAAPPPSAPPRPSPPSAAARPSSAAPPPGMDERACRDLHARYVKARELVGKASDLSYEKMVASLSKQAPGIMKEHGAKGVEFNVVIKGDKVVLKAKPQK